MTANLRMQVDEAQLYGQLAPWFHLLTAPVEYMEDAAFYARELLAACRGPLRTLVEFGSGGGNMASHLKRQFQLTLVDQSRAMLELSASINPECEHVTGDMRTVRLERLFDAVVIHDAISHMTTEAELRRTLETAFAHCRPGGAAVFAPDFIRETFRPMTDCSGHDREGRALRYVEWIWDPDPNDTSYVTDFAYLMRETDGSVRVAHDRFVMGLFPRQTWLDLLSDVGFEPTILPFDHSEIEPGTYQAFLAQKP